MMSIDGVITFSADTAVTLLRPCRNYTPEDLLQAHSKHTLSCVSPQLRILSRFHTGKGNISVANISANANLHLKRRSDDAARKQHFHALCPFEL